MNNKRRRENGLPVLRQVTRRILPPAANGGSTGYSLEHRQDMLLCYMLKGSQQELANLQFIAGKIEFNHMKQQEIGQYQRFRVWTYIY